MAGSHHRFGLGGASEYSQMAFMPLGAPYQLAETNFTYQGIGLGGNSMFNGMLFQTNPPPVFDGSWPTGWHWSDLEPYFTRVRQNVSEPLSR